MNLIDFFNTIQQKVKHGINMPKEAVLKKFFQRKEVGTAQIIHEAGNICRKAIYIEKGVLRQYSEVNNGSQKTYHIAMEGEWVSDLKSFIEQTPSERTIESLENGIIWEVSHEDYLKATETVPFVEYFFNSIVRKVAIDMQARNAELQEKSIEERYKVLLQEKPEYFQRVPLQILASYLGIEPQSLSRLRKRIYEKDKRT